MKVKNHKLVVRQWDRKISTGTLLHPVEYAEGWIHSLRLTLNMSLRQLGNRMGITPQSVRDIQRREKEGTLTIKTLRDAAEALDMKLVYSFIPKDGTLEQMIDRKANEMATKIVKRTSTTMRLEDQENTDERIHEAIMELTEDIKRNMPKKLWD